MTEDGLTKVFALIVDAHEPFLVFDVTPDGVPRKDVFHIVHDLLEDGVLARTPDGYVRENK